MNDVQIDSFVWSQQPGSGLANADTRAVRAIDDVTLQTNDVIEIRVLRNGGEPLRTDFLDFTYVDELMVWSRGAPQSPEPSNSAWVAS